jgi:hypothetical protein
MIPGPFLFWRVKKTVSALITAFVKSFIPRILATRLGANRKDQLNLIRQTSSHMRTITYKKETALGTCITISWEPDCSLK